MKIFKLLGVLALTVSLTQTKAQTAEEIITKHIEAIGGKTNWDKITTLKMEGKMEAQGAQITIVRQQIDKKAMRTDISVMGMSGYMILTQTEGWSFMPFAGQTKPEPMTADDVKSSQDELLVKSEFLTYKEDGKKVEYLGTDDIEGTECHKIKMTDKDGQQTTYYFDAETHYILKQVQKIVANGKEQEAQTTFGNYKKFPAGIVFPMTISGDMMGNMEVTNLEINAKIDESIFKM